MYIYVCMHVYLCMYMCVLFVTMYKVYKLNNNSARFFAIKTQKLLLFPHNIIFV